MKPFETVSKLSNVARIRIHYPNGWCVRISYSHWKCILIDLAYLQAIEIDPNNIIIDEVKEGLLARGDIELTVRDYNVIAKDLRTRLEEKFNTASNGQKADDLALKMVKEIYEPIVKAIDRRYDVIVQFK